MDSLVYDLPSIPLIYIQMRRKTDNLFPENIYYWIPSLWIEYICTAYPPPPFREYILIYNLLSPDEKWPLSQSNVGLHCNEPIQKFELHIPRIGIARQRRNFYIFVSVSDLYISTIDSTLLLHKICGPILEKYKSLTDTWTWKLGLRPCNSKKRNTVEKGDFRCSVL